MNNRFYLALSALVIIGFMVSACQPLALLDELTATSTIQVTREGSEPVASPEPTIAAIETATTEPTNIPSPAPDKLKLWIEPNLPSAIMSVLPDLAGFERSENEADADFLLGYGLDGVYSQWVYSLVAPFKTLIDQVSFEGFRGFWQENKLFSAAMLVMDEQTLAAMSTKFGAPQAVVKVMPEADILTFSEQNPDAWAILPFEHLDPRVKVIALDGQSPIHKDFDAAMYPLTVPIGFSPNENEVVNKEKQAEFSSEIETFSQELSTVLPKSNRLPEELTTVIMTGVTALVRATAMQMEMNGVLYPGGDVRGVMREADIAHVSNEIPFYDKCPEPQWTQERLVFCSDPRYLALLLDVGTDVVDLTGDHFADFGAEAMHQTLDMYDEHQLPYFGGGRNIADAMTPVKFEINGNKIAFLGCNGKEPGYARVSETEPGAYLCNMEKMEKQVKDLANEGYLPIFTFQHVEYYHWGAEPYLVKDFRRIAEAGAVVITGSQGHQPHAYEFHKGSFVHYGLGNLFFDQYGTYDDTDKAFLDRVVFYDGRLIGVELLTVQFFDWAKPTWTTAEQREVMLKKLFEVSDWE